MIEGRPITQGNTGKRKDCLVRRAVRQARG